jgi:uncharacterized damage-inducible protein DinB
MLPELSPLVQLATLHTRLVTNAFDGIDDNLANRRPPGGVNPMVFLLVHLIDARCYTSELVGRAVANPLPADFETARSADDIDAYPAVEALLADWIRVSEQFDLGLRSMTRERADDPAPHRFPVDDPTRLGGLAFLLSHEAYHVGQLGLIRRQLGLPALDFSRSGGR